jgi:antitoxin PrlF
MHARSQVRERWQVTIPAEVRKTLRIEPGDDIEFETGADGTVSIRGLRRIAADQAWFWTKEWQDGEREATEDIEAGRGTFHESDEDFLASLRATKPWCQRTSARNSSSEICRHSNPNNGVALNWRSVTASQT